MIEELKSEVKKCGESVTSVSEIDKKFYTERIEREYLESEIVAKEKVSKIIGLINSQYEGFL